MNEFIETLNATSPGRVVFYSIVLIVCVALICNGSSKYLKK